MKGLADEIDKKDEVMLVNQEFLAKKIYVVRGQKVMLDFELADMSIYYLLFSIEITDGKITYFFEINKVLFLFC